MTQGVSMGIGLPDDFLWGAASAAYAVEGAPRADGRGSSVWDVFSHLPGRIADDDSGDAGADHYRQWRTDVGLMREAGLGAYRFSVSWPRVLPAGFGRRNPAGLDFYDRLVDALLEAGVAPWVCLHHWDLPQALQDRGGWTARGSADWFAEYAQAVALRLGDRVGDWLMVDEPAVIAWQGHAAGTHAPGLRDAGACAAALHNLNRAQGLALRVLRAESSAWRLGTVAALAPAVPADDSAAAAEAAARYDALWSAQLDALLTGAYADAARDAGLGAVVAERDLEAIRFPLDFLAVAWRGRAYVRPDRAAPFAVTEVPPPGKPLTAAGRETGAVGLRDALVALGERYGNLPVHVAEIETAFEDHVGPDGTVHDRDRIAHLEAHVAAVAEARERGVDVRSLFVPLLDGFAWEHGYRFGTGLIQVERPSLRRRPKESWRRYARLVQTGRL